MPYTSSYSLNLCLDEILINVFYSLEQESRRENHGHGIGHEGLRTIRQRNKTCANEPTF